jgi:immunoglobulin-like protein involved in spore germination
MTDERRDDEIIGRALSRAIETIDVNQTPFEKSRIATAPTRRSIFGIWQIATAAAAIVLALAIGSWLTRPGEDKPGVAASPTVPPSPISTVAPTASPTQVPSVPTWVYFARDGLPPVGAFIPGYGYAPTSASQGLHIADRLVGLRERAGQIPAGASNLMSLVAFNPTGGGPTPMQIGWQGDLATVEFDVVPGWGVRGAAQSQALLQQLVYTITEEPGIRRALITEKGKPNAVIDQLVIDRPLSREDVSGYSGVDLATRLAMDGGAGGRLSYATSVDKLSPGLARFVVTAQSAEVPQFSVSAEKWDNGTAADPGKYLLRVQVLGANDKEGLETFDSSPLRGVMTRNNVATGTGSGVTTYELRLDDFRPWRVLTLSNPTRIVVDIGGAPQAISDRIAVYSPTVGAAVSRDFTVSGLARVFEATVSWRVRDSAQRVVASGVANASIGTSALWGAYEIAVKLPQTVSGNVTLEVYEASAKDGSEVGLVRLPLAVR